MKTKRSAASKKAKPIPPRRIYLSYHVRDTDAGLSVAWKEKIGGYRHPYLLIALDAASVRAMDDAVWESIYHNPDGEGLGHARCSRISRAVLAALGITAPRTQQATGGAK